MQDLENRPITGMSPRRLYACRIATTVASLAMLMAGCGSSPEAGPTKPTSKADAGTTAPSPQPPSPLERPFSEVRGWIAYSGVDGVWAVDPVHPERRIRLIRTDGAPIAWSSDGTKLLIRPREMDLVVLDADGTETRLTASHPTGGSFSPDGSEVVYAAGPFDSSAIYAMTSDGGAPRLILRSTRQISFSDGHSALASAYHPAFSPDGTRIAYFDGMYDHSHSLWLANADGTERRVLLEHALSHAGHVTALTWSPDSEWLAFATDDSLYVVRPDGTGLRLVVSGGFVRAPGVQWSPDGSRIAYLRMGPRCDSPAGTDADFTCDAALSIVNVQGGDKQVIGGIRMKEYAGIAWNPRG